MIKRVQIVSFVHHCLIGGIRIVLTLALACCAGPEYAFGDTNGTSRFLVSSSSDAPEIVVHRSANCECCRQWEGHLVAAGFRVHDHVTEALDAVKQELGVMPELASCHTASIDRYVVEGHVPSDSIHRLMKDRPDIRGLTAPGMPLGSPGMEVEGDEQEDFVVLAVAHDGTASVFDVYGSAASR
ncbi:MAG: hypothetical protein CL862_13800 [Cyanobium sp. NAT70]|nr:hypothetical protein [Cyanobium sp. NAT70]